MAELEGLKDDSDARQYEEDLAIWKRSRLAYISSVEISSAHLQVAQRTVRNFRRGMYHGNVDFFKSRLSDWLEARQLELGPSTPFLDHALLDMAPANDHLQLLSSAVKPGGFVTVFYPSITQVLKCFEMVKKDKLPYFLDKVLELDNSNVGGREWDLRTAPIRSKQNEAPAEGHTDVPETTTNSEATTGIVCKPHFGHDRLGTSFLGLFRRLEI